ncbi:MAG: c-type cytochrome [Legionella sp.]|nr:c-type cytochrome [Legionella sp.]
MKKLLAMVILLMTVFIRLCYCLDNSIVKKCDHCHSQQAVTTNQKVPYLGGQHKSYFIKQLHDMKEHRLHCPLQKAAQIAFLDDKDMDDLADYYAKLPLLKRRKVKINSLGKLLYTRGDNGKGIIACVICHGPSGKGNPASFPMIAGLNRQYIIEELYAFKRAKRRNDLNHVMQSICNKMSPDDIKALAQYIENL